MSAPLTRGAGLACSWCIAATGYDFRPATVIIGVVAAFLVRVPLWKPKAPIGTEISFSLLGMLGAAVTIVDHDLGPGSAFWCGIIMGGVSSSLLEIGKSVARSAVRDRIQAAAKILFNLK